jgi:small subunit ribosomal protein S16
VATKIKLMRLGKMRAPYYRIVVADARTKRDGRSIETIGKYHPKEDPSFIEVDSDRAQYWLSVGAQPTDAVAAILRVTGDWQRFKGEPAPPPMRVAEPKADKKAVFEAAARESLEGSASTGAATTPKKKAGKKVDDDTRGPARRPAGRPAATAVHDAEGTPNPAPTPPASPPTRRRGRDAPADAAQQRGTAGAGRRSAGGDRRRRRVQRQGLVRARERPRAPGQGHRRQPDDVTVDMVSGRRAARSRSACTPTTSAR